MESPQDFGIVIKAMDFAAVKHCTQRRKNGDIPYVNHPIGVMRILWDEGQVRDAPILAAAILHDTIEDTKTKKAELEEEFGPIVARIVSEVTDDKSLSSVARKKGQIEHAKHISREACWVKQADKLYNLRDLMQKPPPTWSHDRVRGYLCWAFYVVGAMNSPNEHLSHRLDDLFSSDLVFGEARGAAVPNDEEARRELLLSYYELLG